MSANEFNNGWMAGYDKGYKAGRAYQRELEAENDKLRTYYENGVYVFMNPCDKHSGDGIEPADEWIEKYGNRCTPCMVNRIAELENEIAGDNATIDDLNHQVEGFIERIAELEAENKRLAAIVGGIRTDRRRLSAENQKLQETIEALKLALELAKSTLG